MRQYGAVVRLNTHLVRLLLAIIRAKTEVPQWSRNVTAGQLDIQITSDVDLDELEQPVLKPVGEVNDMPSVQWSKFVAADRVFDVK